MINKKSEPSVKMKAELGLWRFVVAASIVSSLYLTGSSVFATCTLIVDEIQCRSTSGCDCSPYWARLEHMCVQDNPDRSRPCSLPGGTGFWTQHQEWICPVGENACGGSSCFLPGTQITTPKGKSSIETLKAGDKVVSFEEKTGKTVENTVGQSLVSQRGEYYVIKTASGREVQTTAEHPFYTGEQKVEGIKSKSRREQIVGFIRNIPLYVELGVNETFTFLRRPLADRQ